MRRGGDEAKRDLVPNYLQEPLTGPSSTSPALAQSLRDSFYSDSYPHSTLLIVGPLTSVAYVLAVDTHTTHTLMLLFAFAKFHIHL